MAPSVNTPSTSRTTALIRSSSSVDTPKLPHDRDLGRNQPLHGLAHRRFNEADVTDEPGNAVRFERGGLVGPPHGAVERDVPLDHLCTERDSGDGRREPGFVSGIADGNLIPITEARDDPQVE